MYCWNCGKEISDNAYVCPECGAKVERETKRLQKEDDAPSLGFTVLGFFFPLIGLILYLVWKPEYPKRATSCGKGALIGVIVAAVLTVIYVVLMVLLFMSAAPVIY